jgi:hypothetical protein
MPGRNGRRLVTNGYLVSLVCFVCLVELNQPHGPDQLYRLSTKCGVGAPSGVEPQSSALRVAVSHNAPVYFAGAYDSHDLQAGETDQMYGKTLAIHCAEARYVSRTRKCCNGHLAAPSLHSDEQGRRSRLPVLRTTRQVRTLRRLSAPNGDGFIITAYLTDRIKKRSYGL